MMAAYISPLHILVGATRLPASQAYKLLDGYSFKGTRTDEGVSSNDAAQGILRLVAEGAIHVGRAVRKT